MTTDAKQSTDRVINGDVWTAFARKVHDLADIVWNDESPSDPLTRAEGARYLLRFLSAGLRVCLELDDADHPFIDYNIYGRMSWGLDNPDCNYSYARLNPRHTYRIRGTLGSAKNLEFQVTTGHHADGQFADWQSVSVLRGSDLSVAADGSFEVILSTDPSACSEGSSLRMNDKSNFLLIREFFADWQQEKPSSFTMEVVDAVYPPAPLSTAQVADHFDLLNQWLDLGANCWRQFAAGILANEPADIVPFIPPSSAAALGGQAYGMGSFQLSKDKAVILEFTPPDCLVWSISLCDSFFQSIEYEHRQSSLNGHQCVLLDGTFYAVIAHSDPGVANWLDCGGHERGIIAVRYVLTEEVPAIRYRKIKLNALDQYLPDDVQRLTPQARSEVIRQRRLAYQRRVKP